jgi:hypothetical protein
VRCRRWTLQLDGSGNATEIGIVLRIVKATARIALGRLQVELLELRDWHKSMP